MERPVRQNTISRSGGAVSRFEVNARVNHVCGRGRCTAGRADPLMCLMDEVNSLPSGRRLCLFYFQGLQRVNTIRAKMEDGWVTVGNDDG